MTARKPQERLVVAGISAEAGEKFQKSRLKKEVG
jgi:hypothetical protein